MRGGVWVWVRCQLTIPRYLGHAGEGKKGARNRVDLACLVLFYSGVVSSPFFFLFGRQVLCADKTAEVVRGCGLDTREEQTDKGCFSSLPMNEFCCCYCYCCTCKSRSGLVTAHLVNCCVASR